MIWLIKLALSALFLVAASSATYNFLAGLRNWPTVTEMAAGYDNTRGWVSFGYAWVTFNGVALVSLFSASIAAWFSPMVACLVAAFPFVCGAVYVAINRIGRLRSR